MLQILVSFVWKKDLRGYENRRSLAKQARSILVPSSTYLSHPVTLQNRHCSTRNYETMTKQNDSQPIDKE